MKQFPFFPAFSPFRIFALAASALALAGGIALAQQSAPVENGGDGAGVEGESGGRFSPLPPEQAFVFAAEAEPGGARITFQMPDGVYIYRSRVVVTTATPGAKVESVAFPQGQAHEDEFFGEMEVYFRSLTLRARVAAEADYEIAVVSQGCDEQVGICYPPKTDIAVLSPVAWADSGENPDPPRADKAGDAAEILARGNLFWIAVAFFGFGLLLSFTPCVLPMLPILLGIVAGGDAASRGRARTFALSAAYVAGVAATYTAAGIAAGFAGEMLAVSLQRPPMLILFAVVIGAMALSMFGLFEIRAPALLRARAARAGGGGGFAGAFVMGGFAALAASPCVAAPLVGALIFIGKTGDALTGGAALFFLSLGMSGLLLLAGATAGAALPRAGPWTADIRRVAGALLLGLAVWLLSPLLPIFVQMLAYGAVLILCGILLRALDALPPDSGSAARTAKAAGCGILLWGAMMLVGAASGGRDPLLPLSHLAARPGSVQVEGVGVDGGGPIEFRRVADPAELDSALAESAADGKHTMLEFYADWCVSCKEFERFTLSDPRVRARLAGTALLRADVTENGEAEKRLLGRFELFGPPALLFFGPDGRLNPHVRVIGYEDAEDFLQILNAAGV